MLVVEGSKEDLLLSGLAENVARRQYTSIKAAREIAAMTIRSISSASATGTDEQPIANSVDPRLAHFLALFRGGSGNKRLQHRLPDQIDDSKDDGASLSNSSEKTRNLTEETPSNKVTNNSWRGGRAAECAGFENRSARKGSGSSNLPLSVSGLQNHFLT